MAGAAFCTAESSAHAAKIVDRLKQAGFAAGDISVLMPEQADSPAADESDQADAPAGATTGASTGAILGGGLGWLVGTGAFAVPGLGTIIAAGPIVTSLTGATLGGTVGGFTGALVALGLVEDTAQEIESRIRDGYALISLHTTSADDTKRAKVIFEACGAHDISTSDEIVFVDRR